ncbi:hypothetical protein ACP275_10G130800 [Erythranthe tilingii]
MEIEKNLFSHGEIAERNSRTAHDEDEGSRCENFDENDEQEERVSGSNCAADGACVRSQSEALTSVQMSDRGSQSDSEKSSEFLAGISEEVPVEYSPQPPQSGGELKNQVILVHEEPSNCISGQSSQVDLQLPDGESKLEQSTTSVAQPISSIPSLTLPEKELQPVENGILACFKEQDKQNSPGPKPLSTVPTLKTPDGYNWRKYGQKQVKSPEGSRSYFRCTFYGCTAKKIECCDRSNRVVEIVYRIPHNHDPPQEVNCTRENNMPALPIMPISWNQDHTTHLARHYNDSVPPLQVIDQIHETKHQDSCGSDETTVTNTREEANGPEYKRRQKRSSERELVSLSETGKKSKCVVYETGDVGISSDGYRWRKYGQKMVKGSPHPRNYYRCTSSGCPVRKQTERSMDNASAVVISYKGVHDHDIPLPRKSNGPKGAASVAAANNRTEVYPSQTQWSVDKQGQLSGESFNLGGDKISESPKTLLSIEFEIKPR